MERNITNNFKDYLQKDLENDGGFFKEIVNTFSAKVSSLNEAQRNEQKLHSPYCMNEINACWLRIIKELREMINETDILRNKKNDLFVELVNITKELDGPNLLMDTMILTK